MLGNEGSQKTLQIEIKAVTYEVKRTFQMVSDKIQEAKKTQDWYHIPGKWGNMLICEDILERLIENIDTLHELGEITPIMHCSYQETAFRLLNKLDVPMQHALKHDSVELLAISAAHIDNKNR